MRILLTGLAYLAVAAVVGVLAFVVVVILAGPHSDLLPGAVQVVVLILGWLAILVIPVLVARLAWRRYDKRPAALEE